MTIYHKPENTDKSHPARPSLGKLDFTADQAARRFELKGHWACERKGRVRVVVFKDDGNGSHSETHWFDTWKQAFEHFGMVTTTNSVCPICGTKHDEAKGTMLNRAGNWVCQDCDHAMTETMNDLFYLSQGRWKV